MDLVHLRVPSPPPFDVGRALEHQIQTERRSYNILNGFDRGGPRRPDKTPVARPGPLGPPHRYDIISHQLLAHASTNGTSTGDGCKVVGGGADKGTGNPRPFNILSNETVVGHPPRPPAEQRPPPAKVRTRYGRPSAHTPVGVTGAG